jgi:hypothetical protein
LLSFNWIRLALRLAHGTSNITSCKRYFLIPWKRSKHIIDLYLYLFNTLKEILSQINFKKIYLLFCQKIFL